MSPLEHMAVLIVKRSVPNYSLGFWSTLTMRDTR
ncbi:hypothetical protein SAMN06298215_0793 [Bacteroidales bacterium WCE2008]|nr:hypothetical protein SAMN06298215_0793 [Bacteroidales bacterium WCE2008]